MATPTFFGDHSGRMRPLTGNPLISYPACGTLCISIRPLAPTKRIFASGLAALMALAMETAGKICPPVPPPLMMTFMLSLIFVLCFNVQNYKFFVGYSPSEGIFFPF